MPCPGGTRSPSPGFFEGETVANDPRELRLAALVVELEQVRAEHAEANKGFKKNEDALASSIHHLAEELNGGQATLFEDPSE